MSTAGRPRSTTRKAPPTGKRKEKTGGAPSAVRRDSARRLLAGLALCALTLLAFSNSFQAGFILDNQGLLLDPRIREVTPENVALIFNHSYWWPNGEAGLYRPFTTLSYLVNYTVLGSADQPGGYHSINLLLHLVNVLLAYALARRLVPRFWPAVFIAGVWAVHPALTESVTNIVGRADLLAAMAVLSGFLLYLKSTEATGRARAPWLVGLTVVTTIGVFSKESAVAILPIIVVYELVWWKERRELRALLFGCAATLLPIGVMLYRRAAVLAASSPAEFPFTDNPIAGADWWTGRLTAIKAMAHYLWLTVWPSKLSCDYSYNQIPLVRGSLEDWLACGVVLGAGVVVALLYRWNRTAFFLACFAFLNFVPASNLFFPIGTIMADRLLYLPSLGLLACLVIAVYAGAQRMPQRAWIAPVLLSLIATAFAVRTWVRNADWQSDLTMAIASVRTSPNSFKVHRLLAQSLFEADPTHSNIDQVIAEQGRSAAVLDSLPPELSRPEVYRMAGYYYLVKGDQMRERGAGPNPPAYRSALVALERGIAIDRAARAKFRSRSGANSVGLAEGDSQAYLLLSLACMRLGEPDKAYEAAIKARTLDPLDPRVYQQLAAVLALQHREADAGIASAQQGAIIALRDGKWQEGADLSDHVLRSDGAEYPAAYYLNAMANLHLGNLAAAEQSAREAVRIDSTHRNPRTNYVLGLILAGKRDYKQSADLLNAYLKAAPNAPDAEMVRKQLRNIEKAAGR
jgi:tetratricopeptide (TPR) repeat protein